MKNDSKAEFFQTDGYDYLDGFSVYTYLNKGLTKARLSINIQYTNDSNTAVSASTSPSVSPMFFNLDAIHRASTADDAKITYGLSVIYEIMDED